MLRANEKSMTLDEYFELEKHSETRHEYHYGDIYAMSGGTLNHNRIINNLIMLFDSRLNEDCESFFSDVRVQIERECYYTYPDFFVICGEVEYFNNRQDTITNPTLIIEVLSESTKDYDRGSKFASYRKIQSLNHYIVISQSILHVEYYLRSGDVWVLREYNSNDEELKIVSMGIEMKVQDIYKRVDLSEGRCC